MYRSSNYNSPERNSKMSDKEARKNEERRVKDDYLMSYGPVSICQSELKKIEVNIDGISSPVECPQPPLQYDLGEPELFTVYRRPGEGSKPIFANVVVNQPPDFRRVSIRNESPDLMSASEAIRSTRRPSSPNHHASTSHHHHRERSRSRRRSVSRSRSPRSRTPHKSTSSRYRRSTPEPDAYKPSTSAYRPSRSGSVHRRSPKPVETNKHARSSPKRRSSRDSSGRSPTNRRGSPNKRINSPTSRRASPRRYSPSRKYSPNRGSRRQSPRREYEREKDRYRGHHSDKGREYSSRRSPDRRSSPRRHHSPPSRGEIPMVTLPVDPSFHGYYQMPFPPEYWMGLAAAAPMFRPRLPPGFMPRPMRQPRMPYMPRAVQQHHNNQTPAVIQNERPATTTPSSTVTSAQPSSTVTTTAEK